MLEYFTDAAGEWRFRVLSRNGEVVATSEAYTRKADAERGYGDLVATIAKLSPF